MRFKNKVAIVTGASRGLGKAVAVALSQEGCRVVLAARDVGRGETVAREISEQGGTALFIKTDVSINSEVKNLVASTINEFGKIDILINNAGIHQGTNFCEENESMWWDLFRVNVLGSVFTSQAVVPLMMRQRKGKIVNISSKAAVVGEPFHAAYSASKGAVLSLTRALAIELASYNITVNAVCPGPFLTDMLHQAMPDPSQLQALASSIPLGRLGTPEDIVGAVIFFASEESDWCTGQALGVDGGLSILK